MNASNYLELELLDHLLGGPDFSRPANVWFALFTDSPADDDSGTEVTGGSYARVEVANNDTNFPAASLVSGAGTKKNGTTIQFPEATAGWGTVTHFGIYDAVTGGNLLIHGELGVARAVASGDAPRFLANAFVLTAD
jgi:hypothetical protein